MSITTEGRILTVTIVILLFTLFMSILIMLGGSRIFKRAAKSEKMAVIPILNLFTMLEVADISTFFGILLFVPVANVVVLVIMSYKLGTAFKTSTLFKLGLVVLPVIFYPALAFSNYQYKLSDEEYFKELDSARGDSINLMTEDDIKAENEVPLTKVEEEEKNVDSIFKSDISMMEKVAPYKAAKIDILGMEKLKDAPMEDDIFKPIEKIEQKTENNNNDIEKLDL